MAQRVPLANLNSHPCFGRGSTETFITQNFFLVCDRSHPCFGRASTETIGALPSWYGLFSRTPASAGVPLRLARREKPRHYLISHPCFGRGSTETRRHSRFRHPTASRTPASAGVPLRHSCHPPSLQRMRSRTPASAGVPLRRLTDLIDKHLVLLAPLLRQGFH